MKFVYALLMLATCSQVAAADTQMTGRYSLPPSKVNIEPCRREALLLHSGVIEKQRIVHRHEDFWVRFEIRTSEDSEWLVLCDLTSGGIILSASRSWSTMVQATKQTRKISSRSRRDEV